MSLASPLTPKGVEHDMGTGKSRTAIEVIRPLTPKGVEHRAGMPGGRTVAGDPSSDAERR